MSAPAQAAAVSALTELQAATAPEAGGRPAHVQVDLVRQVDLYQVQGMYL